MENKNDSITGIHLWLILWKSMHSVERHALKHITTLNLGITDFAVLGMLLHKGPMPVNTIGKKVFLTSGSITSAVDRLEKKGFVSRENVNVDRRIKIVRLSEKGEKLIKSIFSQHKKIMEQAMSPLSKGEQLKLSNLLKKLGKGTLLL